MFRVLVLSCLLLVVSFIFSNSIPEATADSKDARKILWVQQAGGKAHDKVRAITVDSDGNSYITGEYSDEAKIGDLTIGSQGKLDFLLAKYDPEGKLIWVQTAGGSEIDRGYGVAVDSQGSIYVTGHFQSEKFSIGKTVLKNQGDYDYFIAKYSSTGELIWAKNAGGEGYDYGHGIAVNSQGDVYTCGAFGPGDFAFGNSKKKSHRRSMFVAKYSQDGKILWSQVIEGRSQAAQDIQVDADGDCCFSGYILGEVIIDGQNLGTKTNLRDVFVAKISSDGKFIWARTTGGDADGLSTSLAIDAKKNVFLCGMFKNEIQLAGQKLTSNGGYDPFVARLNSDGTPAWVMSGGGEGVDYGLALALDGGGNCYVTGEFTDDVKFAGQHLKELGGRDLYVAKFNSAGKLDWLEVMGGKNSDLSYAIAVDSKNNCYVSGAFSIETKYQNHALKTNGGNDIFLMKLSQ